MVIISVRLRYVGLERKMQCVDRTNDYDALIVTDS